MTIYREIFKIIIILIFLSSCSIFNSGTVHLKYSDVDAGLEGNRYELKKKLGSVSTSIRQIEHPDNYRRWDYLVKISPSIHLDRFTFQAGPSESTPLSDLKYRRLSGLGNLKLALFTPSGQFVFSAGFGGAVYGMNDGQGLNTIKTREVRKFDIAYNIFLSDRFFLMLGPRYYKTAFEQFTFTFRIGYFWGETPKSLK